MLVGELVAIAVGVVAVAQAVRERGRTRAALERATLADRRYRAWSGERARAMAARNTLSDVAQASSEAARRVQRGSTVVAGALGSLGGRLTDSVRRLASSAPELTGRPGVVRGTVVSSTVDRDDWFALMLEAAEAEDRARAEGHAELPTAPLPVVTEGTDGPDDQPWEDPEDESDDPADQDTPGEGTATVDPADVEPTVVVDVPPDLQWLEEVPRDR